MLHLANDQWSLNSPVLQLHASASRYDIDNLIAELEEPSVSTHIILLHVAMDNTITMHAPSLVRSYHPGDGIMSHHFPTCTLREGAMAHNHPLLVWDLDTSGIYIASMTFVDTILALLSWL